MALAASINRVPPLILDVVDAVASEASLGSGVLIDGALSSIPLSSDDPLPGFKCRSGRLAVSSSKLGWPMSLLAAGLIAWEHKHCSVTQHNTNCSHCQLHHFASREG